VASFFLVSKAIDSRIKGRLRENLQKTEIVLSRREAAYTAGTRRTLATLADNPSLKAGIGLLRESRNQDLQEQVHQTLVNQLTEMSNSLDYDFLLLEDPQEKPIVGVAGT